MLLTPERRFAGVIWSKSQGPGVDFGVSNNEILYRSSSQDKVVVIAKRRLELAQMRYALLSLLGDKTDISHLESVV